MQRRPRDPPVINPPHTVLELSGGLLQGIQGVFVGKSVFQFADGIDDGLGLSNEFFDGWNDTIRLDLVESDGASPCEKWIALMVLCIHDSGEYTSKP